MVNAVFEIKVDTTWYDITDWVLKAGDFEQYFNNFDTSLREIKFDCVLAYEINKSYNIAPDVEIRIKQDTYIIFVGYVESLIVDDTNDLTINITISSVVNKLNKKILESVYRTGVDSSVTNNVIVFGGQTWRGYDTVELLEYIFPTLTGYNLDVECFAGMPDKILAQMFWNIGSSKVSANYQYRLINELWSWFDLVSFLCRYTTLLIWDIPTQRFRMIPILSYDAPLSFIDLPTTHDIWKYNYEDLDMNRNIYSSYCWCPTLAEYFNTSASTINDVVTDVTKTGCVPNNGTSNGTSENINYEQSKNFIWYYNNSFSSIFANASTHKFRKIWKNKKMLINFTNTFINNDGDGYANIADCKSVNIDGRYFSEVQFIEEL